MDAKKIATFKEIPRVATVGELQSGFSIPNPGKMEGVRRVYVSREVVNGWKNQSFTSDDYPDEIPVIYTGKMEEDPGNGRI